MTKKTCMIIGLSLFVLLFVTPLNTSVPQLNHDLSDVRGAPFGFRALPSNATWLAELAEARDIRVHDITQSFKGLTIFCLGIIPNQSTSNNRVGYMIVTNENGEVVNGFYIPEDMPLFPQFINSTTIVHGVKGAQNLSLWNLVTNVSEPLGVRRGNHDVDYNPLTGTFIGLGGHTLTTYEYDGKTYQVKGGDIVEYLRNGTEIGRWDSNSTFPFNATDFHLTNETSKGNIDWMHTNSLYWDVDEDMIYMNVRSRDCIVKVNHATNETVWVLGRYIGEGPGFTLYNKHGVQVDSLFYHAHAAELISPNRLIVYDNDLYNITRPNPEIGISRVVEIEFNETTHIAREIWSWAAPASYFSHSQGDANRLPNGNTYVLTSLVPEPIFSEVNPAGEIVWEMVLNVTTGDTGWKTEANGATHFLEEPLIELDAANYTAYEGVPITVGFSALDVFKRSYTINVTARVLAGTTLLVEQELELLPHWQKTALAMTILGLPAGLHNLTLVIVNPDGVQGSAYFLVNIISALLNPINLAIIGVVIIVAIVIIVFLYRRRSS